MCADKLDIIEDTAYKIDTYENDEQFEIAILNNQQLEIKKISF